MRYRYYELNSPKKILNYFLWILFILWGILWLILGYQFLREQWEQQEKKWGTLVEATFSEISYLPYLKNDPQSFFYQSFLFDACLDYNRLETENTLESDLCKIITQDYQTYYVSLQDKEKKRSDGLPFSLEDIYFTYNEIVHKNRWDLDGLKAYEDLDISIEEDTIKVVFPNNNKDNNYFFTQYILPSKVLQSANLANYQSNFASNPVTSACGKIETKNNDINSLVYNLSQCKDTHLGYYQIKMYDSFESLSKQANDNTKAIVDVYSNEVSLDGYRKVQIVNNRLLTAFFNTKSNTMSVRLRRALGGLIHAKFYTGDYQNFLLKYQDELLNKHFSNGTNIQEFINRSSLIANQSNSVAEQDLEDSGVKILKNTISINGVERRFVFYLEKPSNNFDLTINFSNQFEDIKIQHEWGKTWSPKNYDKKQKKVTYTLKWWENFEPGQNHYTITGKIKGKSYTIAKLDIYGIEKQTNEEQEGSSDEERKIKFIYYNNPESNFTIQQLKQLFRAYGILESFRFEQVSNLEQMEAKLVLGDYDIILNTIDLGMKKDMVKILTTDSAKENPSQYSNTKLLNLFSQYNKSLDKEPLLEEINNIYAQDMPFVIIGYPYQVINVNTSIFSDAFGSGNNLHDYNRREYIYQHLTLVHNTIINIEDIKDVRGFSQYIKENVSKKNADWEPQLQSWTLLPQEWIIEEGIATGESL